MPFTSPARLGLTDASDGDEPVRGYVLVFDMAEAGWVVDWYDDNTGILLPAAEEWLTGVREGHRWIGAFAPASGQRIPTIDDGASINLELGGVTHDMERIGALSWSPGAAPWVILAATSDTPPEPERYTG